MEPIEEIVATLNSKPEEYLAIKTSHPGCTQFSFVKPRKTVSYSDNNLNGCVGYNIQFDSDWDLPGALTRVGIGGIRIYHEAANRDDFDYKLRTGNVDDIEKFIKDNDDWNSGMFLGVDGRYEQLIGTINFGFFRPP